MVELLWRAQTALVSSRLIRPVSESLMFDEILWVARVLRDWKDQKGTGTLS